MRRGWVLLLFLVVTVGGVASGKTEPKPVPKPASKLTPQQKAKVKATCVGPYRLVTEDDRCVWSCAHGTQPWRNNGKAECVCKADAKEVGTDRFGRRVCSNDADLEKVKKVLAREAAGNLCPEPYHIDTGDGRCVWSCSVGTQPMEEYPWDECVCQPGLKETGTDEFGRRVCTK